MAPKAKKTKMDPAKLWRPRALATALAVALVFGLVAWFVDSRYETAHPVAGQTSQSLPASDDYKQLNLALAAKAFYTNTPIKKKRVVNVGDGFENIVFDFSVPKDHLTEHGLMSLPTKPAGASGYPVIVLCHGYTNPISYSTYNAYLGDMEFYARNGFAVIKPDYRGQGLSLADGTPDGAYYSMSYNTDVMSLIAAVKQTPYLDKSDINLWGHSMGAYVALRAAVLSPSVKNVILLSGPVGYVQDMYTSYTAISDRLNPVALAIREDELARFGTPVSDPGFWDSTSPLDYLNRSRAHFQIHVGTADKIVPPHFSADLDQALTKAGKSHEYYTYPGGVHSLLTQRSLIWARSLAALEKKT